ncbi:MAG: GNAT family N-acetyltransferase [Defluviitaleaceae bacterium]|nr:GNAT family N-acetyltransferase [Defluviitaleaceae bacterium]
MICVERPESYGNAKLNETTYFFWRFMIDKNHQGKGYGKTALSQVIDMIKIANPLGETNRLYTSVVPESPARNLYLNACRFKEEHRDRTKKNNPRKPMRMYLQHRNHRGAKGIC